MQKHILGCWKHDFDKILLIYTKNKSLNWINGWTRWKPTRFRRVGSLPSNCTRVDSSGSFTTQSAKVAMDRVGPGPGPEVTVWIRCYYYSQLASTPHVDFTYASQIMCTAISLTEALIICTKDTSGWCACFHLNAFERQQMYKVWRYMGRFIICPGV